ncbi:MAG: orotidine 5'-phosphate decarboxylase, partial [Sulfurimonas sp.]|nr:orotidine 5'-phosphate decarboxylase [Sulfurimonas sp.]
DAYESGLDGVVCSAYESASIKKITDKTFMTLTPGIRPFGEEAADQQRVADVNFAKSAGVDFIVVGRPIYKAEDPALVVKKIVEQI